LALGLLELAVHKRFEKGVQVMNKEILVGYATESGSTAEVANFIGDTLTKVGAQATVKSVEEVENIEPYDVVYIGSPIIYGKCMPEVKKFVSSYDHYLSQRMVVYFITCMRLSQISGDPLPDVPIFVDPEFGEPKLKKEMTFLEKSHPVTTYLKSIMGTAKESRPVSISFFKGALDYSTIGFIMTLLFKFMARIDGLEPGDYRNWEAIRSWTEQTYSAL
jgi:menaquinone-dependent protoporphyrinogen IX oxidase